MRHIFGNSEARKIIKNRPSMPEIHDSAWELIHRCFAKDEKSRPTMDEVVGEMEGWTVEISDD